MAILKTTTGAEQQRGNEATTQFLMGLIWVWLAKLVRSSILLTLLQRWLWWQLNIMMMNNMCGSHMLVDLPLLQGMLMNNNLVGVLRLPSTSRRINLSTLERRRLMMIKIIDQRRKIRVLLRKLMRKRRLIKSKKKKKIQEVFYEWQFLKEELQGGVCSFL